MVSKVAIKIPMRLADVEMLVIEKTLKRNAGHLGHTSRDLDVSYSTLYRRLREFRKAKDCRTPK